MDFSHDVFQPMSEGVVTLATTEPTLSRELLKSQTAVRAMDFFDFFPSGPALHIGGQIRQNLGQWERHIVQRRMKPTRGGAFLAQRQRCLFVVDYLRQVNLSFSLFAVLTKHNIHTQLRDELSYRSINYFQLPMTVAGQHPVVSRNEK